jgi:hypothetical protein
MRIRWGASAVALVVLACSGGMEDPDGGAACEACDDGLYCNGVELCIDDACIPGDPPCAGDSCDEELQACICETPDADGDGADAIECGGPDCDDSDPTRYPGNTEICDAEDHDEDCDPSTFGVRDQDGDGEPDATCCNTDEEGEQHCGIDCEDTLSGVNTSVPEVCNDRDDNCDGQVNEGAQRTFWPDADHDQLGDGSAEPMQGCDPPDDYVENSDDCDDTDPFQHRSTSPELCDLRDNNCNEEIDENTSAVSWYRDADDDTYGTPTDSVVSCQPVDGYVLNDTDCDDTRPTVNPAASESCNSRDDDCDMRADEGVTTRYCRDADGDGHGTSGDARYACSPPSGYVVSCDDCLDEATDRGRRTYGGAPELCNRIDENCSSGGGTASDEDRDQDGHADINSPCSGGNLPHDDCNDRDSRALPGRRTYYSVPHCGVGKYWCDPINCCISTSFTCNSSTPTSRCDNSEIFWDFDCDGTNTRGPVFEMCRSTTSGCVGDGFAQSRPCGQDATYSTCTLAGGLCLPIQSTRPTACR